MTLTEFLLARIAEDEVAAAECLRLDGDVSSLHAWVEIGSDDVAAAVALFSRFSPQRVLAECEAKRQIMGGHFVGKLGYCMHCWADIPPVSVHAPCVTLRALASVYADHPDFQEKWKP